MAHTLLKWTIRLALVCTGLYAVLFATLWVVLSMESVQNRLVPYIETAVSDALNARVSIGRIDILPFDKVELTDVVIGEKNGPDFVNTHRLRIGMFYVPTVAWLASGRKEKRITARFVELDSAQVFMYRSPRTQDWNVVNIFDSRRDTTPDEPDSPPPALLIDVGCVRLSRTSYRLVDSTLAPEKLKPTVGKLTYPNLWFSHLAIEGSVKLKLGGDLDIRLDHLNGQERHAQVTIPQISGRFWAATEGQLQPFVKFEDFYINLQGSILDFDLTLPNLPLEKLFASGVNRAFQADFKPSTLNFRTINLFVPDSVPLRGPVHNLSGHIEGDYTRIRANKLHFALGNSTAVQANVRLLNYTQPENLFIEVQLRESTVAAVDIEGLLPFLKLPTEVHRLGATRVDARFTGYIHDFVTNGTFNTQYGIIRTNINLEENEQQIWAYRGDLATQNLNVSQWLGRPVSDRLNLGASITGRDFDFNHMQLKATVGIGHSNIGGFELDSVRNTIQISHRTVEGSLNLADSKANAQVSWSVYLPAAGQAPEWLARGGISDFKPHTWGISTDTLTVSTQFDLQFKGVSPRTLDGKARIENLTVSQYGNPEPLVIPYIAAVLAAPDTLHQSFALHSPLGSFNATGSIPYDKVPGYLGQTIEEVLLSFQTDSTTIREYFSTQTKRPEDISFVFNLTTGELDPIFKFLDLPLNLPPNTEVAGYLDSRDSLDLDIRLVSAQAPIRYGRHFTELNVLDIGINKDPHTGLQSSRLRLEASRLLIDSLYALDPVVIQASAKGQIVDLFAQGSQPKFNNIYTIKAQGDFTSGGAVIHLDSTQTSFKLNTDVWRLPKNNEISFAYRTLKVNNFDLMLRDQHINLNANVNREFSSTVDLKVKNLEIEQLKHFVAFNEPISGVLNLTAHIDSVLNDNPLVLAQGMLREFSYDSVAYGNLIFESDYVRNLGLPALRLALRLTRPDANQDLLSIKGYYTPTHKTSPLDFILTSNQFPIQLFSFLTTGILYDLSGEASIPELRITGSVQNPNIEGSVRLVLQTGINYLKTKIHTDVTVTLNSREIIFPRFLVFNTKKTGKTETYDPQRFIEAEGEIRHRFFQDLTFNLAIVRAQNLIALNTTARDNPDFYGHAVVEEGRGMLRGPLNDLRLELDVKSGVGTVMNIPLSDYQEQQRLDYVYFIGTRADTSRVEESTTPSFALSIVLNTTVTEDATINLIFDERVGDQIAANGSGQLRLEVSKEGDFAMYGGYRISGGSYQFTFKNLINKQFLLDKGGTINWNGDPLKAALNLQAIYRVENANLKAWDTTSAAARTDVIMKLNGSLEEPQITFGIEMPTLAQNGLFNLQTYLNQIRADEQELSRQVFSLLMLRSVAPIGRFFGQDATASAASASVSEFLSAQLNSWIAKTLDDNIGVSFSLNRDVVMMQLRASLLNNRLTIERNGAIAGNGTRDLTLGNINASFRLLPGANNPSDAGQLSLDIFNRENVSSNTVVSTNRGVGIYYKREFDTLRDLFRRKRKRKGNPEQPVPNETPALPPATSGSPAATPATPPKPDDE